MATKLKNITRNSAVKVVAFVLAVIFAVSSMWYVFMFAVGFVGLGTEDYMSYTQTPMFRDILNGYECKLLGSGAKAFYEEAEEFYISSAGKKYLYEREQEIKNAFDVLKGAGDSLKFFYSDSYDWDDDKYFEGYFLLNYKGKNYFYSCSGELREDMEYIIEYSTSVMPTEKKDSIVTSSAGSGTKETTFTEAATIIENVKNYPQVIGNALSSVYNCKKYLYDQGFSVNDRYTFDDDPTEILNLYLSLIKKEHWQYRNEIEDSEYKNIKYIVFCDDNYAVSNFIDTQGMKIDDSTKQLFDDCIYAEMVADGKYSVIKGDEIPKDLQENKYSLLRRSLLGKYDYNSIADDYGDIYKAVYIGYYDSGEIDQFTSAQDLYNFYFNYFTPLSRNVTFAVVFALLSLVTVVYLVLVAGKKPDGSIELLPTDRIPFIINIILTVGIVVGAVFGIAGLTVVMIDTGRYEFIKEWAACVVVLASLAVAMLLSLLLAFVKNIKNKSFIENTLCFRLLKHFKKFFAVIFRPLRKFFASIEAAIAENYYGGNGRKFRIISSAVVCVFLLLNGLFCHMAGYNRELDMTVVLILINAAVLLYCIFVIYSMDTIMSAVSKTKNGETPVVKDFKLMPSFMKKFMKDVLSIQEGLANAVESAVKDQRMKTELITNVSHDLKTPLTSIVNYVDLLKRCEVENEQAINYIEILDEKSQKLKKLIEDLVEASKASSGATEIHLMKIDLCEVAAQAVGEHEDELKAAGIDVILRKPETSAFVMADSQKTSRVIENLFSNIRKYALENTRVYVEVGGGNEYCTIAIKNISKYPLTMSAQELTQRFVRGDSSRTGEGSGLGLSIAENLCILQKGKFNVTIDGDLFKVTIALPKAD